LNSYQSESWNRGERSVSFGEKQLWLGANCNHHHYQYRVGPCFEVYTSLLYGCCGTALSHTCTYTHEHSGLN
jgi:hypothetical protein